eukprot:2797760-Rhodomonas_salina.1
MSAKKSEGARGGGMKRTSLEVLDLSLSLLQILLQRVHLLRLHPNPSPPSPTSSLATHSPRHHAPRLTLSTRAHTIPHHALRPGRRSPSWPPGAWRLPLRGPSPGLPPRASPPPPAPPHNTSDPHRTTHPPRQLDGAVHDGMARCSRTQALYHTCQTLNPQIHPVPSTLNPQRQRSQKLGITQRMMQHDARGARWAHVEQGSTGSGRGASLPVF